MRLAGTVAVLLLLTCSAAGAALPAPPTPVLLELFTSEGCSSCPPADAVLEQFDRTQPVPGAQLIVLSEHVDYWNALGWRDPFSSRRFTDRQSAYAALIDPARGVYTPEMVIDGRIGVTGNDAGAIQAAVEHEAARAKLPLRIEEARQNGRSVRVRVSGAPLQSNAQLYVAIAADREQSFVTAGENAGRRLSHVAVVRELEAVNSPGAVAVPVDFNGPLRIVAFLQNRATGAIVGVAERRLVL